MRNIFYRLEIGYPSCDETGEMEVDDDMTDDQIHALVHDMAVEYAAGWEGDNRLGWNEDMSEEEYEQETEQFYQNVDGSWEFTD